MKIYNSIEEAREAAKGMMVSNGTKTHAVGYIAACHADGCTKGNGSQGSVYMCDCATRYVIDPRDALCGSTNNVSRSRMAYHSRPAGLMPRNGEALTCSKCLKREAKS